MYRSLVFYAQRDSPGGVGLYRYAFVHGLVV
ncbi:protein of unknown function [Cupriavidus taiwanensis]|nr:protein of unknown function [Cupriavidus taiwanensis]